MLFALCLMTGVLSSCGKDSGSTETTKKDDNTLVILNYGKYIDESVLDQFEKETGIKVVYDVFDSNEVLEGKLMAGSTGFDLVVPSASFLERQLTAGVFQPLDKNKLSNWKNLDPEVLKLVAKHDPDNKYAMPYLWATTGIGFNVDKVKAALKSGEARRKKEQNRTTVQRTSTVVEQNEQKERKGKEINNIERDTRAREDENPLSMFDDDGVKNKPIYELYMKSIGDVSPVIKERLDDLVESYGKERVIVAINTTADNGGNSIKYVETVTAGNLKKEVQKDFGASKCNSNARSVSRKNSRKDEQVDWQAEYERVHGKK